MSEQRSPYPDSGRWEIRGVLAGAYRGHGRGSAKSDGKPMLTHAVRVSPLGNEEAHTLCGRIATEKLCDVDVGGEPTCRTCSIKLEVIRG